MIQTTEERSAMLERFAEVSAAQRQVAKEWLAFIEEDGSMEELPEICEGCSGPAIHRDVQGVELCQGCWDACLEDGRCVINIGTELGNIAGVEFTKPYDEVTMDDIVEEASNWDSRAKVVGWALADTDAEKAP